MKSFFIALGILLFTSIPLLAQNTAKNPAPAVSREQGEIEYYFCPMDTDIHSDRPGRCPLCQMDLVPAYKKTSGPDNPGQGPASPDGNHSHHHNPRPDDVAPAGLMGAHIHRPGEWMIDYRYMDMEMNQIYSGGSKTNPYKELYGSHSTLNVQMAMTGNSLPNPLGNLPTVSYTPYRYMSVPVNMDMQMHMLSAMTSLSENTMVMVMIPYMQSSMRMLSDNLMESNMRTSGVGDVVVSGTFRAVSNGNHSFFFLAGLILPTGSTDEKAFMPLMGLSTVPYNMQPGTGTYGFQPGIAYTGKTENWSWGAQMLATLRVGKNANNYRPGNRYEESAWIARKLSAAISLSLRLATAKWENYIGKDSALDPTMDPQNDPLKQGGVRTDALAGLNFLLPGFTGSARLLIEGGVPVYQHLNGPQAGATSIFNFGLQYTL